MILSITEYFITKIERTVFSMLFGSAVFLSIIGIVTDNYEILKAVDSMDLSKNKRAFTLTGRIENKNLICESFNYNYDSKDEKGAKRLYGTIKK